MEFMGFQPDNQSENLGYFYRPFVAVKSNFTLMERAKMLVEYALQHYWCMLYQYMYILVYPKRS